MWAGITESEGKSQAIPSNHERNLKQHRFLQPIAMDSVGGQSPIPEAGEHKRIGHLALRGVEFRHGVGIGNGRFLACRRKLIC